MYKVFNNDCCDVVASLFSLVSTVHKVNTRASNFDYFVPCCRLNVRKKFVDSRGVSVVECVKS